MSRTTRKEIADYRSFSTQAPVNDNEERRAFVTSDPYLIKKYYELRNAIFQKEWGLTHEKWTKTEHDGKSQIVVFTAGNKVVGGARVLVSENGELLSEEYEGTKYVYSSLMKEVGVPCVNKIYTEVVDIIIDEGYRSGEAIKGIIKCCIDLSKELRSSYIFYLAPRTYCKLYRKYTVPHAKSVKIFEDMTWMPTSEYNYSEDCPAIVLL